VFFYCCGANECLVSFLLVGCFVHCIFSSEFVKVSLISVSWFACISLACGSVHAWWLFGAFSSLDEFFAR